jgi:hypothetical protein
MRSLLISIYMVNISHLEWHISHACNFTCEQCCHFSNHGHNVPVRYEQIEKWYDDWAHRIAPATIDILGGEPLLNKRICDIVELTRKKWDKPSLERLDITTNGVLLYKYPDLPKVLQDNNCGLKISKHGTNAEYNSLWKSIEGIALDWKDKYNINVDFWKSDVVWYKMYKGFGSHMEPYEDNDPEESWNNCITGQDCWQIHEGNLYKCAPLAYLPMTGDIYNLSDKWKHYLTYNPITPDCTDEELQEFFNRKAESFCGMCPKNPQLLSRQNDPRLPKTHYEKIPLQVVK